MRRVVLLVSYDGMGFSGYQVQPNMRTVQGEIERALMKVHKGESIRVQASGRTDTNVHAKGQVLHFDSFLTMETWQWIKAINSCLSADIRVMDAAFVPAHFHSRHDAVKRHYIYRVLATKKEDVFRRNLTYHIPYSIDIEAMKEAANHLLGTHDFTSFCSTKTVIQNKVRTLHTLSINYEQDEIVFNFVGDGFLHNMIRIIVGTLLNIGTGKKNPDDIVRILASRNRMHSGKTAPGHGLSLWQVTYDTTVFQGTVINE